MRLPRLNGILPSWKSALMALASAGFLILAFPDFELWYLAWIALVPLMWAVERQCTQVAACFSLGWIFGTAFFFGTCWWLTYAPIHYAAIPWPIAYFLIFIPCVISGLFPGIFAAILAVLLRRFGSWAFLAAPFVWVFTEFARYWLTGNNWNAIGYSLAFAHPPSLVLKTFSTGVVAAASIGGAGLVGFLVMVPNALLTFSIVARRRSSLAMFALGLVLISLVSFTTFIGRFPDFDFVPKEAVRIFGIQPNVPMSGLDQTKLRQLRQRQIELTETELTKLPTGNPQLQTVVILPESPMNFMYHDDHEFQQFIGDFARRHNVSVLFNSAEPDKTTGKSFNSAVMIDPQGNKAGQYDKIYLLPFGEAVPVPFESFVPAFVGSFSYGNEYDLLPVGDAKAGVMICFESHFGQLSREYVRDGADVIIEMTNDGYLGPTPVLRQHLANAVFRAVETNRPVLRVTNVGITAYIDERGNVLDPLPSYSEGTRVWTVAKSDGSQTFYVKYGDWFAWLCTVVTFVLLGYAIFRRRQQSI